MRQTFFLILLVLGMPAASFCQVSSSDPQTLQALLAEVRELRQDLRISLTRMQSAQILLAQWQAQQLAVTRASQHLDDARSKLAGAQDHQKHVAADMKRLNDELSAEENPVQQKALRDEINRFKSELEGSMDIEQQSQATEIEGEQQLRTEQDKLTALETHLDELVRKMGNAEPSGRAPR